jgi:hypothetical protein
VTLTRIREMLLPNRDPRIGGMSILSDRIDNARLTEGVLLYLASVGLIAAAIIVLYSVASLSLLGTSKETLTGSRIDNNPIEDISIGTVVFYPDSNAAPVPVQTISPSSSEANNLLSSTLVPPFSGSSGDATTVEAALKPLSDGETSALAVETPDGSTQIPFADETPPPEPSRSQQVIAQPPSIADEATAAQYSSGATMPWVATPDGHLDQMSQSFEIQSNYHANFDEGAVAVTTGSRSPETQVKEIAGFSGSTASAGSNLRLLHAASRRPGAVKANRDKIADQLNHAELSRLLGGGRAPRRTWRQ